MKEETIQEVEKAISTLKIRGNDLSDQKVQKILNALQMALKELKG